MLTEIPAPRVLEADRVSRDDREDLTLEDHRSQAKLLDQALDESCAYAMQLWQKLAAMRQYLYDSLPPEGAEGVGSAPHGPDDEQGWQQWQDAFADITSTLCGPMGDSGFGRSEAAVTAQTRRHVSQSPDVGADAPAPPPADEQHATVEQPPASAPSDEPTPPAAETRPPTSASALALCAAAGAALGAAAMRQFGRPVRSPGEARGVRWPSRRRSG